MLTVVNTTILYIILAGCLGLFLMTWFFPLLAILISKFSFSNKPTSISDNNNVSKIAVLIPAHNEENLIGNTICNVLRSVKNLQSTNKNIDFRVIVCADRCTDDTAKIAKLSGAEVLVIEEKVQTSTTLVGKWHTLKFLINSVKTWQPEWVIFVDSGAIWPDDTASVFYSYFEQPNLSFVAPSYENLLGSYLEKIAWNLERHLKSLENYCGGPISVHGATICYRFNVVEEAFNSLENINWLNDDIVLPLYFRLQHSDLNGRYIPNMLISDTGTICKKFTSNEFLAELPRRKRLVLGNIQWIKTLLIPNINKNPIASILAMRRIVRLLWAYWLCITGIAAAFLMVNLFINIKEPVELMITLIATAIISSILILKFRRLIASAVASLMCPFLIISALKGKTSAWS